MITVTYSKMGEVIVGVLDRDMRASSIPIVSVSWSDISSSVTVHYEDTATPAQMAQGESIVSAHIPVDPWQQVANNSESEAAAIPGWATWDIAQANAWGQTNIEQPLAQARTDLGELAALNLTTFKLAMTAILDILDAMWTLQMALGRMAIALRNNTWPHLQN